MTPEHGTRARYRRDGCRCQTCRDANNRRVALWQLRTGHGALGRRVQSAPVQRWLRTLTASGWRLTDIAEDAGVTYGTVKRLSSRGAYDSVFRDIADRILALQPLAPVPVDEGIVARIVEGADHRALGANRAERIAALKAIADRARRHADPFGGALPAGVESINDASRRLALHMSRDVRKKETA